MTLDKTTEQAFTAMSKKWHAFYTSLLITEHETGKFDSDEWHQFCADLDTAIEPVGQKVIKKWKAKKDRDEEGEEEEDKEDSENDV
jgi:hypothetical protein